MEETVSVRIDVKSLWAYQSELGRIHYMLVDRDSGEDRRLWVTREKDPALYAFLLPHVPEQYQQWL